MKGREEPRGRLLIGVASGLMWGLGAAILIQQAGLRSLDPLLLYGLPTASVLTSWAWARRGSHRRGSFTAALLALTIFTISVSQALQLAPALAGSAAIECLIEVETLDGTVMMLGPDQDPVVIDDVSTEVTVRVALPEAEGVEGVAAEFWVEVGGLRITVHDDVLQGGEFEAALRPESDFSPFATPGLYRVGGTAKGLCSTDGYLRIGGSPFTNPIGQTATAATLLGLIGTWYAGRAPSRRRTADRSEEPSETTDPVIQAGALRPRRLEARIFDAADPATPLSGFVAGAVHRIEVTLGSADPRIADPTEASPVTVVLSAPGVMATPSLTDLDPRGPVPASFELALPPEARSIDARLTAVSAGRIAHTVRLPATVLLEAGSPPSGGVNVATVETTALPRPDVAATPFDGAYLVGGEHGLVVSGDAASVIDFDDVSLNETVERIRRRLGEIVEQPGDFGSLDAPGTVELLTFLAHHGKLMRDALVTDHLAEPLSRARYIQVASSRADAYFPFELAYDFAAPGEAATLCPEARSTLASGTLEMECPGRHDETVVCPCGFWGISRVIERHSHQPGERLPSGFVLRTSPEGGRREIPLSPIILSAASHRVDAFETGTISLMGSELTRVSGRATTPVEHWADWEADVLAAPPSVALLLPHTVHSEVLDVQGLEIGDDDRRWAGDIDERLIPSDDRPVIVVLLGCDTAIGGVAHERFPGLFRRAGAEIVLGTITEVLGRHAAPVAVRLVEDLYQAVGSEPVRFGEVMVLLRRRLLTLGFPMVLALATFGDADWLLTKDTSSQPEPRGGPQGDGRAGGRRAD
jgi:hypothetical protein